jgi:hypothetical protein
VQGVRDDGTGCASSDTSTSDSISSLTHEIATHASPSASSSPCGCEWCPWHPHPHVSHQLLSLFTILVIIIIIIITAPHLR